MALHSATQSSEYASGSVLYMAMELSLKTWKLAFGDGRGKTRIRNVEARDLADTLGEIAKAKSAFGMKTDAPIVSCYEAGRECFWIHRWLTGVGVDNVIVDAASMEVSRRKRRAKTDRIDAEGLLSRLFHHVNGEKPWSVVRVPTVEQEDNRHPSRELDRLKSERTRHRNRIRAYLFAHGVVPKRLATTLKDLDLVRLWDGTGLPRNIKARLDRERTRLELLEGQIKELEREHLTLVEDPGTPFRKARALAMLRGVGANSALMLDVEYFGWRDFKNRRQVGAGSGLTGTPWDSGNMDREQGISKAGNARVRSRMIELAWLWIRYQPESKLTRWFQERYAKGQGRIRRVGIVAVARRLLVDFWYLVERGVVPEGAVLRTH